MMKLFMVKWWNYKVTSIWNYYLQYDENIISEIIMLFIVRCWNYYKKSDKVINCKKMKLLLLKGHNYEYDAEFIISKIKNLSIKDDEITMKVRWNYY